MKDDFETCPHCNKQGIFLSPRGYYSRGWPAVCRECGGLAYDRPRAWWGWWGYLSEFVRIPIVLVLMALSIRWLLAGIAAIVIVGFLLFRRARTTGKPSLRFNPVTPAQSQFSRRSTYFTLFAAVAIALILAWLAASAPMSGHAP